MPSCLSLLTTSEPSQRSLILSNHRAYCDLFGYAHACEDLAHLGDKGIHGLYSLHAAMRALRALPDGDLLLVLDSSSAVYRPLRLEDLMTGRDILLSFEKAETNYEPKPQLNWLVLRNTAEARRRLGVAIFELHKKELHDPHRVYATIFRDLGAVDYYSQHAGFHLNLNWQNDKQTWFKANIFIVNKLPFPFRGIDNAWHENPFSDERLGQIVLEEVNAALQGRASMQPPMYPALANSSYSAYNADAPIALVTLYTHHIEGYARISEHNVKRYCDRHGLAYHVYRAIPDDLDVSVNGAWHKPWLLQRHFDQHEWVIWIDADVLFTAQSDRIHDLLEGKDLLLAKDIGGYEFNSGVMGFRCTEENRAALAHVRKRISVIEDKSSVYASGGDQEQFILGLMELGRLGGDVVMDCLSFNTPPLFRSPSTFMVHYLGLHDPYRALYMARDDAKSIA